MKCSVIIPAGGQGRRIGTEVPKQFLELNGKPLIIHTLETFEKLDDVDAIVLAVHKNWYTFTKDNLTKYNITKVKELVYGGERRQDSVYNGIKTQTVINSEIVLVHDAVRPFTTPELIKRIIDEAEETGAAIPVIDSKDTIKERTSKNFILKTFLRSLLCAAQTPQGFWYDVLFSAYENAYKNNFVGTDSASLVEYNGYKVSAVDGEDSNIKITTPFDLEIGKMILERK